MCGVVCAFRGGVLPALRCAHLVQVVQGAGASGVLRCAFRPFIPAFRSLSCFAFVGLLGNMPLFRVLRGFNWVYRLFVWVCIACVLCVACVAFVCVNS